MPRLLQLLPMLWALSCAPHFSVVQQSRPGDPPPPPPPADDYSPKRWKEFSSPVGRFKVLLPGAPQASDTTLHSAVGDLVLHAFRLRGVIAYDVTYVDYPANVEDPSSVKKFFDALRDGGLANVAQANPLVVKESDFSLDGHPGRFVHLELAADTVIRIKYVVVENRVYNIVATSRKARPNVMGSESDYEEIAMTFLDSFQITKM